MALRVRLSAGTFDRFLTTEHGPAPQATRLSPNPSKYSDFCGCNVYFTTYAKFLPDGIRHRRRAEKTMPTPVKLADRRSPIQARSRRVRAAIMAAAHDVMRERGVRAVTTNAIAERADIKIGSLYDYFSNKEAVIAELYEEKLAEGRAFLEAGATRIVRASWREQTADLIRGMWTYQLGIGLDRSLVDASYYYEDLLRIARAHSQLFATT